MGGSVPSPVVLRARIARLPPAGDLDATLRRAAGVLRGAVPFDDWVFLVYDADTMLPTSAVDEGDEGDGFALRLAYCRNEHLDDDVNKFRTLARSGVPVATLDQATGGAPERSLRYQEILRPQGMARELRAALVADGVCWGSLTLLRSRGAADFSPVEVAVVAAVTSDLAARLRDTVRLAGAGRPDAPPPGIVVVGPGGEITQVSPAAQAWLDELSAAAGPGRPAPLPIAGLAVRASAGAASASASAGAGTGDLAPRLRVPLPGGGWLTAHATAGHGQTTVILEPSRPRELFPLLARAYQLTAREEQVVQRVLLGDSTRQIAQRLRISAHTVQDHLKSVFDKTGVRSRGELAFRFALAYW
jgi:DNA-binding CsgD family transcriptional regulator